MPNGESVTGKFQALMDKANGSKKGVATHSASAAAGSVATITFITLAFGPLTGLAKIDAIEDTIKTMSSLVIKHEESISQSREESKESRQDVQEIKKMVWQIATKDGIKTQITKDTAIVHYPVFRNDTGAISYWKRNPTVDSFFIPRVVDTLPATRPR
jgi:hypothetical protein